VKYLTIQEITCAGPPAVGAQLDSLMDALLDLEAADSAIEDPDLAADVSTGQVEVQFMVDAADPAAAMVKALSALRAAIHAIGDAAPGWETTWAVMHVAPTDAPERLLNSA
jgi:phosphatidylserine/phosphatidylglycerophosphate/cardiolipin synthase-like enzyme